LTGSVLNTRKNNLYKPLRLHKTLCNPFSLYQRRPTATSTPVLPNEIEKMLDRATPSRYNKHHQGHPEIGKPV
jgi:hypothetical protein